MMAAALAEGETIIRNAACEPEIEDLGRPAHRDGRAHRGPGARRSASKAWTACAAPTIDVIPDRIETGTFIAAGAMAGGEHRIQNCHPSHLQAVIEKFRETGVRIEEGPKNLRVRAPRTLKASNVTTLPTPASPPTCRRSTWR